MGQIESHICGGINGDNGKNYNRVISSPDVQVGKQVITDYKKGKPEYDVIQNLSLDLYSHDPNDTTLQQHMKRKMAMANTIAIEVKKHIHEYIETLVINNRLDDKVCKHRDCGIMFIYAVTKNNVIVNHCDYDISEFRTQGVDFYTDHLLSSVTSDQHTLMQVFKRLTNGGHLCRLDVRRSTCYPVIDQVHKYLDYEIHGMCYFFHCCNDKPCLIKKNKQLSDDEKHFKHQLYKPRLDHIRQELNNVINDKFTITQFKLTFDFYCSTPDEALFVTNQINYHNSFKDISDTLFAFRDYKDKSKVIIYF